jgi:hypothetical protein
MEKKKVCFNAEPELIKKLKFLAVERDRSLTELYIEAIQLLLKKYEKKGKK